MTPMSGSAALISSTTTIQAQVLPKGNYYFLSSKQAQDSNGQLSLFTLRISWATEKRLSRLGMIQVRRRCLLIININNLWSALAILGLLSDSLWDSGSESNFPPSNRVLLRKRLGDCYLK